MESSTQVLRRMLDERGVQYETYIEPLTGFEHVKWNFNEHGSADFNLEFGEPWLTMYGTISGPEQAIAATLGTETCHVEETERAHMLDENAKLRELVVDAHACKENDGCCEDCYADEGDCPIELRMRKLGIEVDR